MRTPTSAGRRPVGGLTAGVVGASGHAGGELRRLLLGHTVGVESGIATLDDISTLQGLEAWRKPAR
ncbi:hypothetical protein AB0H12_04005 [Actinosynnema sp. NPDC023794]